MFAKFAGTRRESIPVHVIPLVNTCTTPNKLPAKQVVLLKAVFVFAIVSTKNMEGGVPLVVRLLNKLAQQHRIVFDFASFLCG